MRVLVFGASGLLGSNFAAGCQRRQLECIGTYHTTKPSIDVPLRRVDLRQQGQVREIIAQTAPEVVINSAAMTDVDACETNPSKAVSINADAAGTIASSCKEQGSKCVHISTDYVFDGACEQPYAEDDTVNPIQTYGRSKAQGEQRVQAACEDALIVRPSFIYGIHRGTEEVAGFPAWVLKQVHTAQSVPLIDDQHMTPSRAASTATSVLELADADASGVFHVASRSCVTPYEFAKRLCERVGCATAQLESISRTQLNRNATRPVNTCLHVGKLEEFLGRAQPTLGEDLQSITTALTDAGQV